MNNFAGLDLNLLRVFDAMMLERNTTRAGERLGLSQPAVSAALSRLRDVTRDPLFVRVGNKMAPTSRAEALAEPVRAALARLEAVLSETDAFEPATDRRTFRLLGSDYFSILFMPPLAALIEREGPQILLQMLDRARGTPQAMLAEGLVDVCLEPAWDAPDWVSSERLFTSHLVGVAAKDNPHLAHLAPGEAVPAELFSALRHALLSIDGEVRGTLDPPLRQAGIARRLAVTLPHFHAVALAVSGSSLFAALPVHFARFAAPRLGLSIYELPAREARVEVLMYWHSRHDKSAAHRWLRGKLRDAWRSVEAAL